MVNKKGSLHPCDNGFHQKWERESPHHDFDDAKPEKQSLTSFVLCKFNQFSWSIWRLKVWHCHVCCLEILFLRWQQEFSSCRVCSSKQWSSHSEKNHSNQTGRQLFAFIKSIMSKHITISCSNLAWFFCAEFFCIKGVVVFCLFLLLLCCHCYVSTTGNSGRCCLLWRFALCFFAAMKCSCFCFCFLDF